MCKDACGTGLLQLWLVFDLQQGLPAPTHGLHTRYKMGLGFLTTKALWDLQVSSADEVVWK